MVFLYSLDFCIDWCWNYLDIVIVFKLLERATMRERDRVCRHFSVSIGFGIWSRNCTSCKISLPSLPNLELKCKRTNIQLTLVTREDKQKEEIHNIDKYIGE